MVDYLQVAQSGISMLITILIGYFVNKFKLMDYKAVDHINVFLLKICYLPMIMRVIAVNDIRHLSIMPFVVGICGNLSTHIFFLIIFLFPFKKKFKMYLSSVLPSVYINYLIVGFPIFNAIWPENENVMITVICLSNDLISVPIYLFLSNIYNIRKENQKHKEAFDGQEVKFSFRIFLQIGKRVITNPIIIGIVLGFVYSATGWKLCTFLDSFLKSFGNSVLALCLYCVGGFLSQHSLIACNWIHFVACLLVRHVVMPGFVALYSYLFGLSGKLSRQCVIMSCLPSATASYILSTNAGVGAGLSSTMIFWTTIFCVPFMLGWLFTFNALNIFPEQ
ncbi:Auxin Efflux Carrier family protein [Tritrichomonas foetus]|uniref:Auxin Efflux Carrier family protein n=1 Tax=Tritrichomonas foetus TaxID=1144522 RepID=A0A1J4KZM9_9EUKA|nr:Auxin Efflux Carrier family protein [Tritrichomonas foetus]|eukprot:OHT16707.1 Auxin Efflux Carrier family protein [Tritrichomonas foetus]